MKKTIILLLTLVSLVCIFIIISGFKSQNLEYKVSNNSVSISLQQITKPILGVAFHLVYPIGSKYLDYNLGSLFLQDEQEPIVLIHDLKAEHKILVGISLKRSDQLPTNTGEIVNFKFSEDIADINDLKLTNVDIRTF